MTLVLLGGLAACTPGSADDPAGLGTQPDPPATGVDPPKEDPDTRPSSGRPPPAISGGTLLATRDGRTAVAADPDRDVVWIVDLAQAALRKQVPLQPGDEPGRLVEDSAGRVHVALRGGGALLTLDAAGQVLARRAVCGGPRGVAFDAPADLIHVACQSGELVSLPAAGGDPVRRVNLGTGLRDVLLNAGKLYVSSFEIARLYELGPAGELVTTIYPRTFSPDTYGGTGPLWPCNNAWRTLALPGGGVAMLHQRFLSDILRDDQPAAFQRSVLCKTSGVVHSSLSFLLGPPTPFTPAAIGGAVLPVDFAVAPDRSQVAIAAPGSREGESQLLVSPWSEYVASRSCIDGNLAKLQLQGGVIAVAFDPQGRVLAQTREPAALHLFSGQPLVAQAIPLPGASRADEGHALFHRAPNVYVACASCHPEGGQDSVVWRFFKDGSRRTQDLRGGGLRQTAPFHWDGALPDLQAVLNRSFSGALLGPTLDARQVDALGRWLDALPAPAPPPLDAAVVARGQAVFQSAAAGCATCHSGPRFTNNQGANIGTGAVYQVPSLTGLAARRSYLHDGCAATPKAALVGACIKGGGVHGGAAGLGEPQLTELTTYLLSL